MKNMVLLATALVSGFAAGESHVDKSDFVYLKSDDPGGSYSWAAQNGRWVNGQTGLSDGVGAPNAAYDYLVTDGKVLRGNQPVMFGGRSLVLDNGGTIKMASPDFSVLKVYEGTLSQSDMSIAVGIVKGPIDMMDGGSVLKFVICPKRCYRLLSTVTGDEDAVLRVEAEAGDSGANPQFPFAHLMLNSNLRGFKGRIVLATSVKDGKAYRPALSATYLENLGAGDPGDGLSAVEMDEGSLFFGCGLSFEDPSYSISARSGATIGSYSNLDGMDGLEIGGGSKIKLVGDSPVLNVSNIVGRTKLANVIFESTSGMTVCLQDGETVFGSGYNNPEVGIYVSKSAKMVIEPGAILGVVTFENGADVPRVSNMAADSAWFTNNVGFSVALFSSPSLGGEHPSIDVNELDCYAGVPREALKVIDQNGLPTLCWHRDEDTHPVRWMNGSDSDKSSFAEGVSFKSQWCDGAAPDRANDYVVSDGRILRARESGQTFAGHALRVLRGGDFSLHVNAGVNGLEVYEGGRVLVRGESTASLAGTCSFRSSKDGYAFVQVEGGKLTFAPTVNGSGNVRYCRFGEKSYQGDVFVTGDNEGHVGKVWLGNTDVWGNGSQFVPTDSNQVKVYFKGEKSIGGNPPEFVADGLTLSPWTTFTCSDDYPAEVTSVNRGVNLLGDADNPTCFDISAGRTCRILSNVSGSGRLVKRGDGTLMLGGANAFSGDAVIEAGVLELANASALAGSRLLFSAGALRIACDGPVLVGSGAEPPLGLAAGASVGRKLSVSLSAWDLEKATAALFLFPNETTARITPEWLEGKIVLPQISNYKWIVSDTEAGALVTCKVVKMLALIIR